MGMGVDNYVNMIWTCENRLYPEGLSDAPLRLSKHRKRPSNKKLSIQGARGAIQCFSNDLCIGSGSVQLQNCVT